MDTELTAKEFFEFAKEHEKDKDLQFDLTENEQEVLLHTLGYYKQGYISVRAAEWRNYSDNGSNDRGSYTIAFRHLCELSLMREHIDNNHYIYSATELGKKVARIKYVEYVKEQRKEVKIGRRRYKCFLYMNELDDYDSFGDWLNLHTCSRDWEIYKIMFGI